MKGIKMEKQTSVVSYISAWVMAAVGGLTLEKTALIVGICTALGTFLVNWFYQARRDRREAQRNE